MANSHTCVLRKIWQKYNYMLNISKSLLTSLRAYKQKSEKSIPLIFCFVHPDSVEPVFRFYILTFTKEILYLFCSNLRLYFFFQTRTFTKKLGIL